MWPQHTAAVPVLAVSHSAVRQILTGVKREDERATGVLSGHLHLQSSCLHVAGEVSVALLNRFCVVN